MKISVIIVVYNRKDIIEKAINSYLQQSYPNIEIIVIDNASSDGSDEIIKKYEDKITSIKNEKNIYMQAFDQGLALSCGDIIWRTDDDAVLPDNDFFARLISKFHENENIDLLACEVIEMTTGKLIQFHRFPYEKSMASKGIKTFCFSGAAVAIKKKVFDNIGTFWGFGFEEKEFATRAIISGFNLYYFPDLIVEHYGKGIKNANPERWKVMTRQHIRYHIKYFPLFFAFRRTLIISFFHILYAILNRFKIGDILSGIKLIFQTIITTYKQERIVVKSRDIYKITLGESLFSSYFCIYKNGIINRVKRWLKAN